jgi:glutamate synthase (NADPH/NADH) small chain
MSEFKKPESEKEYQKNFAQIKPLMNLTEANYESSRCLFCYDAPCVNACPTSIDIPLFIRQINTGNITGAAKTIYSSNYFGNACGKVCPTEVLCEGACVYNLQEVKPIDIGRLQNFATQKVIENQTPIFKIATENGKKIAIIGAGPAGIACACELSSLGYAVTIYEAKALPSGLTVHGVAPYKITNEEVLAEVNYLQQQFGFVIHYHTPIETKEQLQNLENNFDAIFLGIGLGKTSSLGIKGENLENSIGATEFIEQLRKQKHLLDIVGKKVLVLGGGNTAMDAASEVARMGAETVTLAYRRGKEMMSAYEFEYELAKSVGVKGIFYVSPIEILGDKQVRGVKMIQTEEVNGKLQEIKGTEFEIACDMVIRATGQSKQVEFLSNVAKLAIDNKGKIVVSAQYQTSNPKYFAGGDVLNGGAEVVNAAQHGKDAAKNIHTILNK